mgnify:CR=1 FL=1
MATDIDTWFSLSYSNYLVLQRSILQSMPLEWQHRFTAIMDEMNDAMGPEMQAMMPSNYFVAVLAREQELVYEDCDECEGSGIAVIEERWGLFNLRRHRIKIDCPECEGSGKDYDSGYRRETPEEVGFVDDPVPHYSRTRTRIDFETGREARWCQTCKAHHGENCPA